MTTVDLIVDSYASAPAMSVYQTTSPSLTTVYSNSFGGFASFAGPIVFDPKTQDIAFIQNGTGSSSGGINYGGTGNVRLYRKSGSTWNRDASDILSNQVSVGFWDGKALSKTSSSNGVINTYDLATAATSTITITMTGGGGFGRFDIRGDWIYYIHAPTSGSPQLEKYNLRTGAGPTAIMTVTGAPFIDVHPSGRFLLADSTSIRHYSAAGTLLNTLTWPGSGTTRMARFSYADNTRCWVLRGNNIWEMDLYSGSTIRSIGRTGIDSFDVHLPDPTRRGFRYGLSLGSGASGFSVG